MNTISPVKVDPKEQISKHFFEDLNQINSTVAILSGDNTYTLSL